jgi:predicted transcriptional regulator
VDLREVKKILNAECLCGEDILNVPVSHAFAADLLSDVLAYAKEGTLLVTGTTNPQVVRTSEMLEFIGIVFVRGKRPDDETITLAETKRIPLLSTRFIMFETCGRLYRKGLCGCIESVAHGPDAVE